MEHFKAKVQLWAESIEDIEEDELVVKQMCMLMYDAIDLELAFEDAWDIIKEEIERLKAIDPVARTIY